jgi:retron-type reverse transcriptase
MSTGNVLLLEDIFTYQNLKSSANECKSGTMWKDSTVNFMIADSEKCIELRNLILGEEYQPLPYHRFLVCERGKTRVIHSLAFQDRVINKLLNRDILKIIYEPKYIKENAACQKGKGTDYARREFRDKMHSAYLSYGKSTDFYILKCDVKSYFDSISHNYIKSILRKDIKDDRILHLLFLFLDNYCTREDENDKYGINLGSETSQTYGLLALNYIDHFIKEQLHIKYYVRYADDFVLISNNKDELRYCKSKIDQRLSETHLRLHEKKSRIYKATQKFTFLGYTYMITDTGKVILNTTREKVTRERQKLKKLSNMVKRGDIDMDTFMQSYKSYRGTMDKWQNYRTKKSMDRLYMTLAASMIEPKVGDIVIDLDDPYIDEWFDEFIDENSTQVSTV